MHLHHLALGATNVDLIAAFYSYAFSLPERSRQSDDTSLRAVWLELDPGVLMVERLSETSHSNLDKMQNGLFLMAFKVSKTQRKAIEKRVEEKGGSIETRTEFTTYFRDPENNRVAISSHSLHL